MKKVIEMLVSVIAMLAPQLKSKESKEGSKEIKEAIIGVNEVSLFLVSKLKDGAQFQDGVDFYNKLTQDNNFKSVVQAAYEGYEKIPAEAKDIDAGEGLEIVSIQLNYLPKYVNAFSKQ